MADRRLRLTLKQSLNSAALFEQGTGDGGLVVLCRAGRLDAWTGVNVIALQLTV
jgi:hypothetical protein